jgi:2-keto-4-pentenoate hydratase/2-oxohepta-3-ene-1,7-dioic acid hydratase in catechol pathway
MTEILLKPDINYSVGKIVCVGQNYTKHIKEMSAQKTKTPVLFLKPSTAIIKEGTPIFLPEFSVEVHHEVELALLIGKLATKISSDDWLNYIAGAGIALDLTLRDLQREAKDGGLPWSVSKGFDGSCPLSDFVPISDIDNLQNLSIRLDVNGQTRQKGNTSEMIFSIPVLIAYISMIFTLEPGDIILTGTPSGVSPLTNGDVLEASIEKIGSIKFNVA